MKISLSKQLLHEINENDLRDTDMDNYVEDSWTISDDIVTGDVLSYDEPVFSGSFKKPRYEGNRHNVVKIVKDSYGERKQQHTFTINVISSSGESPLVVGSTTCRKGRNLYKGNPKRLIWKDETNRGNVSDEKHRRGDKAREDRFKRKEYAREDREARFLRIGY